MYVNFSYKTQTVQIGAKFYWLRGPMAIRFTFSNQNKTSGSTKTKSDADTVRIEKA